MAKYESVRNDIWDAFEEDELSASARLLYMWSWSNPRCGMAGIYRVSKRAMLDSGISTQSLDRALEELADKKYLYYVDGVLWVRTRIKHLHTQSGTTGKAVAKDISQIPEGHQLRNELLHLYGEEEWLKETLEEFGLKAYPLDTPSIPHQYPIDGVHTTDYRLLTTDNTKRDRGCGGKGDDEPATDFPADLLPALEETLTVLERIHAVKGGKAPTRAGVGRAIAAYPRRAHVQEALALESWFIDGKGSRQKGGSIIDRYRNWLSRAEDEPDPSSPSFGRAPTVGGRQTLAERQNAMMNADPLTRPTPIPNHISVVESEAA